MKITQKLKMVMIPMMLLPALITFLGIVIILEIYVVNTYGETDRMFQFSQISNPIETVRELIEEQVEVLETIFVGQTIEDLDTVVLDEVNLKLQENKSYLLVKKGEDIVYLGTEKMDAGLKEQLPKYTGYLGERFSYIATPDSYLVCQIDFSFADDNQGSVFVITYLGDVVPKFQQVTFHMGLVLVLVFVLSSMTISAYMYYAYVKPIQSLKEGTTAIMEGNWDYEVQVNSEDELGDLCQSFNEMRNQLQDSMKKQVEAEEKNRELIANISHDLKTPITSIKGYVEGLMDGVADSKEKQDKYIRIIYNKANEMDSMINELSLYTKLNSNAIPYNFRNIDIDEYFQDCVDELVELNPEKLKISYMNHCSPGTRVMADPEQIKRVIDNIVTNSIKYNDKELCEVHIRLNPVNDMVQFEFADNGVGISEDAIPNVFNRTYRADEARRSTGGSGLGLAIAKKVIEEHGGTMWCTSRLKVGTSIFFTLQMVEKN